MSNHDNRNHRRIIVKFGGSSLADSQRIALAVESVAAEARKGNRIVVVVSAIGKMTDQLMSIAKDTAQAQIAHSKELDDILSMGERTSARLFSTALKSRGVKAKYFDPMREDWPIITDETYGDAYPILEICAEKTKSYLQPLLEEDVIPIIPGFIGRSLSGRTTTIGRGGSDTTAFILGRYLNADRIILVTDVDGIMSADPKIVKEPKLLSEISARALACLADSGTKFIHKKALKLKPKDIDVKVISQRHGKLTAKGTVVKGEFLTELGVEEGCKEPITMATVVGEGISEHPEIIQNVTSLLRSLDVELLGMSANHNSLILYLRENAQEETLDKLHQTVLNSELATAMAVRRNLALLRVNGIGLEDTPGLIGRVSSPFNKSGLNIYGIFTITSSINVVIDWSDKDSALSLINKALKEELK